MDVPDPQIGERLGNGARWASRNLTWLASEAIVGVGTVIAAVPNGILQGLELTWDRNKDTREDIMKFLMKAGEFFKHLPLVGGSIERYFLSLEKDKRYEILKQIVDTANWVPLFTNPTTRDAILKGPKDINVDLIDRSPDGKPDDKPRPEGEKTVLKFLSTCEVVDRRKYFLEHLDHTLTKNSQNEAVGNDAFSVLSPEDRLQYLEKNNKLDTFTNAMGGAYGVTRLTDGTDAYNLARSSLTEHYADQEGKGSRMREDDYKNSLRLKGAAGSTAYLDNSVASFQKIVPPSLFKGALDLGVIAQADIDALGKRIEDVTHERDIAKGKIRDRLDEATGESKLKIEKDGRTFMDTFQNMSGVEKLVLFGAAIYLLKSSKFFRNIGITAVAVYFGLKFFNKDENPGETMSKKIQQGVDWVKGKGKTALGIGEGPMDSKTTDAAGRAKVVTDFLPTKEGAELENQAMGLSLLAETPLALVAGAFTMGETTPDGMRPWRLNVEPGSVLDRHLAQVMQDHGWKMDYRKFFADYSPTVADAVGYSFYRMAIKDPTNAALVRDVEKGKALFAANESEIDFNKHQNDEPPNGDTFRQAERAYTFLVGKGSDAAMTNTRVTLGNFILEEVGIDTTPKKLVVDKVTPSKTAEEEVKPKEKKKGVAEEASKKTLAEIAVRKKELEAAVSNKTAEIAAKKNALAELKKSEASDPSAKTNIEVAERTITAMEAAKKVAEIELKKAEAEEVLAKRNLELVEAKEAYETAQKREAVEPKKTTEAKEANAKLVDTAKKAFEAASATQKNAEASVAKLQEELTAAKEAEEAALNAFKNTK